MSQVSSKRSEPVTAQAPWAQPQSPCFQLPLCILTPTIPPCLTSSSPSKQMDCKYCVFISTTFFISPAPGADLSLVFRSISVPSPFGDSPSPHPPKMGCELLQARGQVSCRGTALLSMVLISVVFPEST